jgi:hypothetical protein
MDSIRVDKFPAAPAAQRHGNNVQRGFLPS